jgi:hypothetical protein
MKATCCWSLREEELDLAVPVHPVASDACRGVSVLDAPLHSSWSCHLPGLNHKHPSDTKSDVKSHPWRATNRWVYESCWTWPCRLPSRSRPSGRQGLSWTRPARPTGVEGEQAYCSVGLVKPEGRDTLPETEELEGGRLVSCASVGAEGFTFAHMLWRLAAVSVGSNVGRGASAPDAPLHALHTAGLVFLCSCTCTPRALR